MNQSLGRSRIKQDLDYFIPLMGTNGLKCVNFMQDSNLGDSEANTCVLGADVW